MCCKSPFVEHKFLIFPPHGTLPFWSRGLLARGCFSLVVNHQVILLILWLNQSHICQWNAIFRMENYSLSLSVAVLFILNWIKVFSYSSLTKWNVIILACMIAAFLNLVDWNEWSNTLGRKLKDSFCSDCTKLKLRLGFVSKALYMNYYMTGKEL